MKDEQTKYYDTHGDAPYLRDLLRGKLRIYDVPPEFRTEDAYIYAARWARDVCREIEAGTEKRLIEYQVLSDMIALRKTVPGRCEELRRFHYNYYASDLNIYNSEGLI